MNLLQNRVIEQSFLPTIASLDNNFNQNQLDVRIKSNHKPFIEANTIEIAMDHLQNECIIPVFSKDNERLISHSEFIDTTFDVISRCFGNLSINDPEIRVSHEIKGRTPDAIHKNTKDLLNHEKTIYYERMAFIINIPDVKEVINGNEIQLSIGGVRNYSSENLHSKKTLQKFKIFIGFQNKVCCNMCVSSDGFINELKINNLFELEASIMKMIDNYDAFRHFNSMKNLLDDYLTEHQFSTLIGRSKLYQYLPREEKRELPDLLINDNIINSISKDYYKDESFCKDSNGNINLWNVYNLLTQANKSNYIDTFFDRNLNSFDFIQGVQQALNGNSKYHWFLS
ncbi:DUF3871 family protein [Sphingobacterium paucimobilis]|uniref:DUF3871 family protein n=1 Tax=Sphingobacterium paucimobilis HER1398 TaxID=1346330 RepID=U2H8S2_9SPHI|nr:DUF3871 family protein [Sphingobacterium paucimobilis]ERJ58111.1 hypothetical protein M472_04970 [Sphingobacterium paucimobilis HER1398]